MPRVFIDPHLHSKEWFVEPKREMLNSKKVTFLFANCEKGVKELGKVRAALEFRKLAFKLKRAVEAPRIEVEKLVETLKNKNEFSGCRHCDDPHIFASIYLHPAKFVFSEDARMAKCRDKIRPTVNKKYCDFIIIKKHHTYLNHRQELI